MKQSLGSALKYYLIANGQSDAHVRKTPLLKKAYTKILYFYIKLYNHHKLNLKTGKCKLDHNQETSNDIIAGIRSDEEGYGLKR